MSRSLNDLRPEFRVLVDGWTDDLAAAEIDHLITCTLRSAAEQDALYASGRTVPGPIRTKAKAYQSAHQYGLALDFVILTNGKTDWSGDSPAWEKAISLAQSHGMHSLRPMESAHLEHPDWHAIAMRTQI